MPRLALDCCSVSTAPTEANENNDRKGMSKVKPAPIDLILAYAGYFVFYRSGMEMWSSLQ
jgi:hypothetical protein